MNITALYLNIQHGDRVRIAPSDTLWINGASATIDEVPEAMSRVGNTLTIKTKAQEASTPEEYEAIMDGDEREPWAKVKLPPMVIAYDTIYSRAVTSIITVTDEETTDD
jgi:hypothetical protein